MSRPRVFLSAVSVELRSARQRVARTVRTLGYDPVSQDDFPTGYGELRQWLREQIDGCEGMIQLVGDAYGAEPPDADPEFGRVSYTQFELLHAHRKGKKTWVVLIGDHCSRDHATSELDLPENAAGLEPAAVQNWQAERRKLQQAYLDWLVRENHLRHTATDDTALENIILKLRDELAKLRRTDEIRQHRLWKAVVAVLIGLLMLSGGGWWATQHLTTTVQQAAVVDAEKIRAHLLTTIEETHRQELAEAETASDWRERQKRREAADAAHAMWRMRVDELATSFAEIEARGDSTSVFRELSRILAEQGVDEAIAYMAAQKTSILQSVRTRAAAVRERNRSELEPLLRTAELYGTKGAYVESRALYAEILDVEPDWPQALHAAFWFHIEQGNRAHIYSSIADAQREYVAGDSLVRRLTELEPANTEWQRDQLVSHNKIGDVLVAQGDGEGALVAYREGLEIARTLTGRDPGNTQWQRDLSLSHDRVGDVLAVQGDGLGALTAYRKTQTIAEALARRDPGNTKLQRDVAASYTSIGDVLVAQGNRVEALAAFRRSLLIAETLAESEPTNTRRQHDVAANHQRIGDVLLAQGDRANGLAAYRKARAIAERLAERDPTNTEWKHALAVSYQRIGDVLVVQGDSGGALAEYRKALAIGQGLIDHDLANTKWQQDVAASHARVGDVLVAQGDKGDALASYRMALAISEALARRDPANLGWQHALAISHQKIGDVLVAQGDSGGALASYQMALVIAEAQARGEPANMEWHRALAASHQRIGDVQVMRCDRAGALAAFRKSLEIAEALTGVDPANMQWKRDTAVLHQRTGDVLMAQGDGAQALAAFQKSLEIHEAIATRDPANTQWQVDVAVACGKLSNHKALPVAERRELLLRGREILQELNREGRLHPNQDHVAMFDAALATLPLP
ncbi:tetratricopeptide repeat protein [Thauera sinica]|uniref:Tetratricopeptide repeat protein n=2 Tax=Thauera TaxID=33057 RepID=A0ABW1AVM2_9RHOO|nr:tetratricopeptide repeat protein [Thauera sp. K11]